MTLFISIRSFNFFKNIHLLNHCLRSFSKSTVLYKAEPVDPGPLLPPNFIPEPPPIPQLAEPLNSINSVVYELNSLGEPTLQSLGLSSWWPSGLVQAGLEHIHVGLEIPWWTSIVLGSIILRLLTFPLVVINQRNVVKQHNTMPIIQFHHNKFNEAQKVGDILEASKHANILNEFSKKHNISPIKSMIVPFLQMPIFISVFIGLRGMANLPVESMATGGISWFTDLTIADPYFLLPVITTLTLFTSLEIGVDTARSKGLSPIARNVMRVVPFVIFPFTVSFPSCILVYWCTSNFFALFQILVLKIKGFKEFLKIPQYVIHDPAILPEKKPFLKQFKASFDSKKNIGVEERLRQEAIKFKEAGMGAIPKTYDYDPTKVKKVQLPKN